VNVRHKSPHRYHSPLFTPPSPLSSLTDSGFTTNDIRIEEHHFDPLARKLHAEIRYEHIHRQLQKDIVEYIFFGHAMEAPLGNRGLI
jgi:hypothetical protein